jgi:hypothetical protein
MTPIQLRGFWAPDHGSADSAIAAGRALRKEDPDAGWQRNFVY